MQVVDKEDKITQKQICFSISRSNFLNTLARVTRIVERRNANDIYAYVNIEVQNGYVRLKATTLDISVFASLTANVLAKGEVKISACVLYDIVRKLPNDLDINFKIKNQEKLSISCGNVNYSLRNIVLDNSSLSGDNPSFCERGENYKHEFTLSTRDLIDLLSKTKFAISLDDTRYNLNGVYFHTDKKFLCCVATDGHRLSLVKKPKPMMNIDSEFGVIIPYKAIMELLRVLDSSNEINIKLSNKKIQFTYDNYILISKLIDGTFPDYKSVIPGKSHGKQIVIESSKLASVIDRVSVVSSNKIKSIKFSLKMKLLTLSSSFQEHNDAIESIEVDYDRTPIEIGFNSRYLLDALSCIKRKCKMILSDSNSAAVITDEDDSNVLYIVMPIRT